jgi:putative NADH-flavin reductase
VKLAVFGANGPTGRLLTQRALDEGHTVTAVTRRPECIAFEIAAATGDRRRRSRLSHGGPSGAGQGRVISTLGVPYTKEQVTTFSQGTRNIAEAMSRHGLRRLVCVSSIGVHTDIPPQMTFLFRRCWAPLWMTTWEQIHVISSAELTPT